MKNKNYSCEMFLDQIVKKIEVPSFSVVCDVLIKGICDSVVGEVQRNITINLKEFSRISSENISSYSKLIDRYQKSFDDAMNRFSIKVHENIVKTIDEKVSGIYSEIKKTNESIEELKKEIREFE